MSMAGSVDELVKFLDLEQVDVNLFRGSSPPGGWGRVFGGQVIAQSLVASQRTIEKEKDGEKRICHSLHCYFLRGGDPTIPILFRVVRSRDGRSFSSRRVIATQKGKEIFHFSASFQKPEKGLEHYFPMPEDIPSPDELPTENEMRAEVIDKIPDEFQDNFLRVRPIDMRFVNHRGLVDPKPTMEPQYVWLRSKSELPSADIELHQTVLSYASDMSLLDTGLAPHGINFLNQQIQMASLDHSMWFHHPFRADEWLLYAQDSPVTSGGRGFNRGLIYTQKGELVVSVTQEGLMRVRTK